MDLFSRPAASCCYFSFLKKNHPAAPLYMEGLTKQQLSGPPGRELQEQLSGPQVIVYLLKILYSIIMKMGKHAQTYMTRTHGRHTYVLTTQAVAALHGMTPVPFVLAAATRVYLHPQGTKSAWHGPHVRPLGQVPTRARPGPACRARSGGRPSSPFRNGLRAWRCRFPSPKAGNARASVSAAPTPSSTRCLPRHHAGQVEGRYS
jgi:hypothetical protein